MLRPSTVPNLTRFSQDEFAADYWQYNKGEHVSLFGPTGSGKTTLQFKLLNESAAKKLKGVVLVVKPKDKTVDDFNKILNFKRLEDWPPSLFKRYWHKEKRGWLVWPKPELDARKNQEKQRIIMQRTIMRNYYKGDSIIVADETYGLSKTLRLELELSEVWTKGRSMGAGLWSGTQRPAFVPGFMYDQPSHIFIANDGDKRSRERYGEIGGTDRKMIENIVQGLNLHEFLYIQRAGPDGRPKYCILTP